MAASLRLYNEQRLTPYKCAQIKLMQQFTALAQTMEDDYQRRRKLKQQEHKKAMSNFEQRNRVALKKIKASHILPRRIALLKETAERLQAQHHTGKMARDIEKQAKALEDKFWRKTLGTVGGPMWVMEKEERDLRDKQELELSVMAVEMEKHRKDYNAKKIMEIQRAKHATARKSEHPFSIWYAAAKGDMERVSSLMAKHPEQLDAQDPDMGLTPLHYAARQGHLGIAQLLLDRGADINTRDGNGNTALHYSAGWGTMEVTALLLESGGELRCTNLDGKMPLDLAMDGSRARMTTFLERWQPVGVSLSAREVMSRPDPDPFEAEPDPHIRQQLRLLEIRQSSYGAGHPGLMVTLKKLARLYRAAGRLEVALGVLVQLRNIAVAAHGEESIEAAWAFNEVGEVQSATGDADGAEDSFRRAIEAFDRVKGHTDPEVEGPLKNLALHYLSQSMVHEAEPVLRRLLAMQNTRLTTEMHSKAEALIETHDLLAYTLLLKKDFNGAREHYDKSYAVARQYYDEDDERMAQRLENLGMLAFSEGDDKGAEGWFCRAHDAFVRSGRVSLDEDVCRTLENMAVSVCRRLGGGRPF